MSRYKVAQVTWIDAWFSDHLVADVNLLRETAGWLVTNNKRIVRVALTIDERGPADIINIPRAYVRKVRVLDVAALRDEQLPDDEIEPGEDDMLEAERGY